MRIDVLSLFPAMLDGFLSESMLGRAQENVHGEARQRLALIRQRQHLCESVA